MKASKAIFVVTSLLMATSAVMAQTAGPQSNDGNRLDPMVKNQDPNAVPNTRAEVKSERGQVYDPKDTRNREVPPTKGSSMSNSSRGEVKAQAKQAPSKADTDDLSRATDPMSDGKKTSTRAQRKADAKAKRESKMSGTSQSPGTAQ